MKRPSAYHLPVVEDTRPHDISMVKDTGGERHRPALKKMGLRTQTSFNVRKPEPGSFTINTSPGPVVREGMEVMIFFTPRP